MLAVERKIVAVEPHLAADKATGNWEIEFFNSDRYNAARKRRAPEGYGADTPRMNEFVSVHVATSGPASPRCCCRGRRPTR